MVAWRRREANGFECGEEVSGFKSGLEDRRGLGQTAIGVRGAVLKRREGLLRVFLFLLLERWVLRGQFRRSVLLLRHGLPAVDVPRVQLLLKFLHVLRLLLFEAQEQEALGVQRVF